MVKSNRNQKLLPPKNKLQYAKMISKADDLFHQSKYKEALTVLNTAWAYDENEPIVLASIGRCLIKLGERKKALDIFTKALSSNLENALACDMLGNAALEMNMPELAEKFFRLQIQLDPTSINGYNNLATTLRTVNRYDEAIAILQDILPIYQDQSTLWNTLATVVAERDGISASLPFYQEAQRLAPDDYRLNNNLMGVYHTLGNIEDAIEAAKKSINAAPGVISPHMGLSALYLAIGELEKGWEEYTWRNNSASRNAFHLPYNIPNWQGEDLTDKTLFISAEQGVGDEILFAMLYPNLIKEAKKLIIGVDRRLMPLYQHSFPEAEITPYVDKNVDARRVRTYPQTDINAKADFMTLCGMIPRYRMHHPDKVPVFENGYLTASDTNKQKWAERLSALPHKINVGISWRSGKVMDGRQKHYSELEYWVPILETKGVNFINVQYGDCQKEIDDFTAKTGLKIHQFDDLDLRNDFEGTAALMQNLDLVIGPASSPQMQAMSVGTPTWWLIIEKPWWFFGHDKVRFAPEGSQAIIKHYDQTWQDALKDVAIRFQNDFLKKRQ